MSKEYSIDDLHLDAINQIESFIKELKSSGDKRHNKKAKLFCFWLRDYVRFLKKEDSFKSSSLRKYKRGEIIKAHLGMGIGSEQGGLHYCVVIDNNNSIQSPIVTVVPLTSIKEDTDLQKHERNGSVFLGNEIFMLMDAKLRGKISTLKEMIQNFTTKEESVIDVSALDKEVKVLNETSREIKKLKSGSLAHTKQITSISKLRIYDPKKEADALAGIRISNASLDKIDEEIRKNFMKPIDNKK